MWHSGFGRPMFKGPSPQSGHPQISFPVSVLSTLNKDRCDPKNL